MTRTIANALLVAALALAAPAISSVNVYVKLKDVNGEVTNSKPATPGKDLKNNEAPKPAGMLVPAIQKTQEAPKPAAKRPRKSAGGVKGKIDYGWKVERGEK